MKRRKIYLLTALTLNFAILSIILLAFNGSILNTFANGEDIWYHYPMVSPTENMHGSKEFWGKANDGCHTISLYNPGGTILENRDFSLNSHFNELDYGDERYIPSNFETRNAVYPILNENNTIYYGIYPQKVVEDNSLIEVLNTLTTKESNGWYLYNGEYYTSITAHPRDSTTCFDNGDTIVENYKYWFKCEPIEWNIFNSVEGNYFVYSKLLLNVGSFSSNSSTTGYSVNNYKHSEIRSWLNETFYKKAFSLGNCNIKATDVNNSASTTDSGSNPYACENTKDNLFLLSYKECQSLSLEKRYGKTTEFTRAIGGICYAYESQKGTEIYNNGYYWTRSPKSDYSFRTWVMTNTGEFHEYIDSFVSYVNIRPALTINLNPTKYEFSVSSEDGSKGKASIIRGRGFDNELMIVRAVPSEGCVFKGWYSGLTKLSEDLEYSFNMPSANYSLVAKFNTDEEEYEWKASQGLVPDLKSDGRTITYGLYPQTKVNDSTLISNLNLYAEQTTNDWYLFEDHYYTKTGYIESWYKCEPISWEILSNDSNGYYLLSKNALDVCAYESSASSKTYKNTYNNSWIRTYLNNDFYNNAFAFDSSYIQVTSVDNSASTTDSDSNRYKSSNTNDRVFLPSYQDYLNSDYGFSSNDSSRKYSITQWADSRGSSSYAWTRSPYSGDSNKAWAVAYYDGSLSYETVTSYNYYIRPAITLKLDSVDIGKVKYDLSLSSENEDKGTVSLVSGGVYSNQTTTIQASPKENVVFKGWYDKNSKVSDELVYTFVMPCHHYSLVAHFMTKEEINIKLGAIPSLSSDGKHLTYGLYPQTKVTDASLVSKLNTSAVLDVNDWYLFEDHYYVKAEYSTEWYKCEPISWNIMSKTNNEYYIISTYVLDSGTFESGDYKSSKVRSWLNNEFYNKAFHFGDSNILLTELDNSEYYDGTPYLDEKKNTEDKIFLPDYATLTKPTYGFSSSYGTSLTRVCLPTDWASYQGLHKDSGSTYNGVYYWTRSFNNNQSDYIWSVTTDGSIRSGLKDDEYTIEEYGYSWNTDYGVRLAMRITL